DGANLALAAMNGFNLLAAMVIGPAFLARFGIADPLVAFGVTAFPLAFSSLFYAIPGGRALLRRRELRKLESESLRAHGIGAIIERKGGAVLPEELVASAARRAHAEPERVRKLVEQLLVELDGDVKTDEEGRTLYAFPRAAEELAAVAEARRLAPAEE